VDIDETAEKAISQRLSGHYLDGQTTTDHVYPLGQLEVRLDSLGAKVIVSPTRIQLFYEDFRKLDEIESVLREIVAPSESAVKICKECRISVPTIHELRVRQRLSSKIRRLRDRAELEDEIAHGKRVIKLLEGQERALGWDNRKRIQELKELVAQAQKMLDSQ